MSLAGGCHSVQLDVENLVRVVVLEMMPQSVSSCHKTSLVSNKRCLSGLRRIVPNPKLAQHTEQYLGSRFNFCWFLDLKKYSPDQHLVSTSKTGPRRT